VGGLREIAAPFVAAVPAGARVRARLRVSPEDEAVLRAAGRHLGMLAGRDLAARCAEGRLDARGQAASRARRKRALTGESSSRWAGPITRTSEDQYRLTADGEKGKPFGNETIRWHPDERWLELKLPAPLARLANRPHGRYRLSCPVTFTYRGDEVAAQAATGAVRYDMSRDPGSGRWYLDASWKTTLRRW
jgi:hypothetical protein